MGGNPPLGTLPEATERCVAMETDAQEPLPAARSGAGSIPPRGLPEPGGGWGRARGRRCVPAPGSAGRGASGSCVRPLGGASEGRGRGRSREGPGSQRPAGLQTRPVTSLSPDSFANTQQAHSSRSFLLAAYQVLCIHCPYSLQ